MNGAIQSPVTAWLTESEVLQLKLLEVAANGPPRLKWRLMYRLVPSDFLDAGWGEQFALLRETWFARNSWSSPSASGRDYPYSSKTVDDMIDRLARLAGAVRTTALLHQLTRDIEGDLACYDEKLERLNSETSAELGRLAILKAEPDMWRTSRDQLVDLVVKIERRYVGKESDSGHLPGWADLKTLDAILGEFRPGRFYLLGAAQGNGKSAFLAGLATACALAKHCVGIISLRDSSESMSLRLLGGEAQIDPVKLLTGVNGKDFTCITNAAAKLDERGPL